MTRLALPFAVLLAAASSACFTSWFLLNSDEAGLPCAEPDPADPTKPVCLAGYACIDGVCLREAAKQKDEECTDDRECETGLVCRDVWDDDTCGADPNCALGRQRDPAPGLRCRTACDPDQRDDEQCSPGERCFIDVELVVRGFCQSGTCEADSDCGNNVSLPNMCVDRQNPPGLSGTCITGCDPLTCDEDGSCQTCPALDLDGDGTPDNQGCEPLEGGPEALRLGCIEAGTQGAGEECDNAATACRAGMFCLFDPGETVGFCSRWCRVGGGQPACDALQPNCNPLGGDIGFCR